MSTDDRTSTTTKAQLRQERREKKLGKRIGKTQIALKRADFPKLTGISARRFSTLKRRGKITLSIPSRIPRRPKAATKTIAIVGFRELITMVIIQFLMTAGFSEEEIFEGDGRPRSRGLLLRCEMVLEARHGNLDEHVLVVERKSEVYVKVTRDWPMTMHPTDGVQVLDFRRKIPKLVNAIMELKHQPRPMPPEYSIEEGRA